MLDRGGLVSGPEICGDVALSLKDQWRYVSYGLRQIVGSIGQRCPLDVARIDFDNDDVRSKILEGASPLRVYTASLAADVLKRNLGEDGPICDIGCGAGSHSRFFETSAGHHFYIGVDVALNSGWPWQSALAHRLPCRFAQMTAGDLGIATGSLAFTFSSSSLEHVPNIQLAVAEIARVMRSGSYGLHVVPGVWSLFLYLFHGYRRFHPKSLADLFQSASLNVERIWSLGGLPSFLLHALWITGLETIVLRHALHLRLQLRTGKALSLYVLLLNLALRLDPLLPLAPAGYGVLIRKP